MTYPCKWGFIGSAALGVYFGWHDANQHITVLIIFPLRKTHLSEHFSTDLTLETFLYITSKNAIKIVFYKTHLGKS